MKPPVLKSERLTIKSLSPSDAEALFTYRSDSEVALYQSFSPKNVEEARQFIADNTAGFNQEGCWFQMGVYVDEELIGDIGIHFIGPENSQCEIGYTLSRRAQGKGYATEAVTAVLVFLFNQLGKHRVTAGLDPRNTSSIKLLERIGFRREGHFIKSYLNKGIWEDDLLYALLGAEWVPLR